MDSQDRTMLTTDRTMVAPAAGMDATILGTTITCPICKTENSPSEKYCGECGFLLASTPVEDAALPDTTQMPRLTDASGQREYLLKEGANSIGREATDVLLNDPTVSRGHARVILEAGSAYVEDMGSSNGTYAAGIRIQPGDRTQIVDGAELKFGSAVMTLILPAPVEAAEPAAEDVNAPTEEIAAEESTAEIVEFADEVMEPVESEAVEVPAGPASVAKLVSPTDPTREFPIIFGSNTIGRRAGNDIVLEGDPYVSGAHAQLDADERGLWLTDIGSTNGTTLNGTRIGANMKMALNPGDEIVFGQTALNLVVPEQEVAEETGA